MHLVHSRNSGDILINETERTGELDESGGLEVGDVFADFVPSATIHIKRD